MRSWPHRVILTMAVLFGFTVAVPVSAVPDNGSFPLSWLTSWLSQQPAWAVSSAFGALPSSAMGLREGRGGYVSADATDGHSGTGRAPSKVAGGLDGYRPYEKDDKTTRTLPSASAFNEKTSVRMPAESSAKATMWRNADGTYTRQTFGEVVNYKAADGTWQPIDTTLKKASGGRWQVAANDLQISVRGTAGGSGGGAVVGGSAMALAAESTQDLVTMTLPSGEVIGYDLAGASIGTPSVSGGTAEYASVLPDTDLRIDALATEVKESLILHSAQAATSWTYPLNLQGVTASLDTDGAVIFSDSSGTTVARMPRGFMKDSSFDPRSGDAAYSHDVSYELTIVNGEPAVRVSVDQAWLADPARVFPVTVDPTVQQQDSTTGETYVMYGDDTDHSGEDNIAIGTYDGGTHRAKSLLHFDNFVSVFATTHISAVSLNLFLTWQGDCTAQMFWVHAVTQAWSATSVRYGSINYDGPPMRSPSIGHASPNSSQACNNTAKNRAVGDWVGVGLDVTDFNNWVTSGGTNYGLGLVSSSVDNAMWKRFTSRNGPSGTACDGHTCAPYLLVDYTIDVLPQVDTRYPANNSVVSTLTPALTTRAHDPDNWPAKGLKYQYVVYNENWGRVVTSPWQTTPGYQVPAGLLAWNKNYYYTVQLDDYSRTTTQFVSYAFSTPVPQPTLTSGLSQNPGKGYDPSSGNYTTSATDAQIAGVGPDLEITRYYNSVNRANEDVAFGMGWTSVVDMRATQNMDVSGAVQTVTVRYPNGQEVAFGRNSDGSFTPPQGRYAVFKALLSGTTVVGYSLTDKDATTYTFSQAAGGTAWKVSTITDANGRKLTFTYDATSGLLTKMTSASGRSLYFEWSTPVNAPRKYVSRVFTDPAVAGDASTVKSWTYNLNYIQLMSVCAPASGGGCTTYSYDWISQGSNTVLNSGPYSYWRLGDASGSIAKSSVLTNAGTDNGLYKDVTVGADKLYGTTSSSANFNGTSSYVQLPGKLVTDGSYQSVSLWFKTATAGGVLFSYSASAVTAGTTAANYVPALYIDANGYLRGEFWQGISAPIKSTSTVTNNAWHHVVLSGAGATQTMYLDGVAQGSLAGTISMVQTGGSAYEYLGAGFVGNSWPDHVNTGASPARATHFTGQIADTAFFTKALTSKEAYSIYDAARWSSTELKQITRPSGKITATVAYDTATAKVKTVTDENGGVWTLNNPTVSGNSDVYVASVLGSKPQDYWRLDDPVDTTDAVNEVAGGVASYGGTVTYQDSGPFADSKAITFDGTSTTLTLPAADIPTATAAPASMGLWFKTTSTVGGVLAGFQTNELGGADANYVPALYVGLDGKLRGTYCYCGGAGPMTSAGAVNDGKWHYAALTRTTTGQTLFLDGVQIGTKTTSSTETRVLNYGYIGAGRISSVWPSTPTNGNGYFAGSIGEVAFYNATVSAADIAAQFEASKQTLPVAVTTVDTTVTQIPMPVQTVSVTDPGGKTLSYNYDLVNGNRMIAQTDTLGNTTRYGYDTGGFSNLEYDARGVLTQTVQDTRGNTIQQITCQDQEAKKCSSVYYEYYLNASDPVDPRNDQMTVTRDGRSASATDNTYKTTNVFDAKGNQTTVTDPLGRVSATAYSDGTTTASFDGGIAPAGLPVTITSPSGAVQKIDYYASGDVGRVTTPAGKVTTYAYDKLGRKTSERETTTSFPNGLLTYYTYDDADRVLVQTDPAVTNRVTGAVHTQLTTNVYDADGNLTSQTISDSTGGDVARTESAEFNQFGQKKSETDAMGKVTQFAYDLYGRVVLETDADGGQTKYEVDAEGNVLKVWTVAFTGDPNNPSTAADKLLQSKEYDPASRLGSETDAMGWTTLYDYTDNGLVSKVTRTDNAGHSFVTESNTYDAAGNMTQQVANNGGTTTAYEYDAGGRLWRTTLDPAGVNRVTTNVLGIDDTVLSTKASIGTGSVISQTDTLYDVEGRSLAQTSYNGDPATTPVARWKLNETNGTTAADASGNTPATGTGVTWTGSAATFNGSSSYLVAPGSVLDTSRSFTISTTVKITDKTADRAIVTKDASGNASLYFQYQKSTDRWLAQMPSRTSGSQTWYNALSTSVPQLGVATHLTCVFDAQTKTLKLYVNGALESTVSNVVTFNDPQGGMWIGRSGVTWFSGSIADVQVYQAALTAAQVSAVYTGAAPAADAVVSRTSSKVGNDGLVLSSTDANANTTDITYDEASQPTVITAAAVTAETVNGSTTARPVTFVGYNTFGDKTETVDGNGNRTTHVFDRAGREYETQLPAYTPPGSPTPVTPVVSRTYDVLGQLTTSTDPLGKVTTYEYDQLGRVSKVTAPDLSVTKAAYDLMGNPTSSIDATGALSGSTYDYLGHQLTSYQRMRPSNVDYTTTNTYDTSGRLQMVTTPGGSTTSYTYNAAGDTLTSKINSSRTTTYAYDGLGRPWKSTNPDNTYSQVTYDMLGRATATTSYSAANAVLAQTSGTFDKAGNQLSSTDAEGAKTTYTYDPTGMVLSETQPISTTDSILTTFGYDLNGNRTRFTDGRGSNFWTTYNTLNLAESQIEPATTAHPNAADRTFTTVYNKGGQVASQLLPGGVTQTYAYDDNGRLTSQTGAGAEGATADRTFGYDPAGRMTSLSGSGGTNSITYDDRGLPLTITGPSGDSSFAYDLDGAMTSRTDAAGTTNYEYYTSGADTGLLKRIANSAADVDVRFDPYNTMGSATKLTYYTGSTAADTRNFGYDDLHRLTSDEVKTLGGATVAKVAYGWNRNSDETSKTTTNFGGATKANTYKYDQAGRLIEWNDGTAATAYTYDKSGNRTQNGSRLFSYDERNRLIGDGATTYNYTARGTMSSTQTGSTTQTTTADAFGQVLSQDSAGGTQTYSYDGLGRVIKPGFAYTGLDNDLAADGVATYVRDPSADVIGEIVGSDQRLAFTDLHDDVVGQFSPTSTALEGSVTYDPLGKVVGSPSNMIGNLGYQSEWTDSFTGRVNMLARWYNTDTGQFDTRDTVSNSPMPASIGADRYQYGDGKPLTVTDPTGHCSWYNVVCHAKSAAKTVTSYASSAWSYGYNAAASAYHQAAAWGSARMADGLDFVSKSAKKLGMDKLSKVADKGRKHMAKKAHEHKEQAKKHAAKARQAGKQLVNKVRHDVKKAVKNVKDAAKKAGQWIKDHKAAIVGTIAAVAVGLGCGALIGWTGVGAVACGALAGAVGSVVTGAMNGHTGMELLKDAGKGALSGAIGGLAGPIGGKIAGAVMGKIGSNVLGRVVGGAAGGALGGGVTDAAAQYATTGKVDWGQVGLSAAVGGVMGGVAGAKPKVSCHSFDPQTKVLMADGTSKAIKDVKIGDKVKATNPETGKTEAKPVTVLHNNNDNDLADVTIKNTKTGKSTVLHTTWHHPFWNVGVKQWTDAKDLKAGDRLRDANGEATQIVTAIKVWTGLKWMRDLTVEDVHTYYVVAAGTPVLVHNCDRDIYDNQGRTKHGESERNTARGVSGAEPSDGQAALDNSVEWTPEAPGQAPRRFGTSDGELVVLDRTQQVPCGCTVKDGMNNIWHGHVRAWDQFSDKMQKFLIRMKMVDKKGRPTS